MVDWGLKVGLSNCWAGIADNRRFVKHAHLKGGGEKFQCGFGLESAVVLYREGLRNCLLEQVETLGECTTVYTVGPLAFLAQVLLNYCCCVSQPTRKLASGLLISSSLLNE